MKSFNQFHLDTVNHLLWREGERVPLAPKAFDVLTYLVEHAGRVVTQDELLEALWQETYVNPEVLRKYILEIRRALKDRPESPEFIETVTKRGYRFVASVVDESAAKQAGSIVSRTSEDAVHAATTPSDEKPLLGKYRLWLALIPILTVMMATALVRHFRAARNGLHLPALNKTSIVVLPFVDLSVHRDQEYFSDGLSEELINDLAKVSGLKVVGRSSAFQFKGKNEDLRDIGRRLGVDNVLEGSVRRDGNHVRITAELIKAEDGFQLWSQTYDREINDIFTVQDEIARSATEALQVKLLGSHGQPVASTLPPANPEAYQAYLEANYFLGQGYSKEGLSKALAYADQAITLDQKYAPAWALRAAIQNRMTRLGLTNLMEGYRRARADAERAIELDPNLASGYLALAWIQNDYDWDWDAVNASLMKAADLEPGSAEVFYLRSYLSRELGNLDQAIKLHEHAVALDPLRPDFHLILGHLLYLAGRYDEARAKVEEALDMNPQIALAHITLGKILMAEGKPQEALPEIGKESNEWGRLTCQALVYHSLGREQDSDAALNLLIAKYGTEAALQIAEVYAFRGETSKSFEWLERAYNQRDSGLPGMKIDPQLKTLYHDPRFTALLTKMRLPP